MKRHSQRKIPSIVRLDVFTGAENITGTEPPDDNTPARFNEHDSEQRGERVAICVQGFPCPPVTRQEIGPLLSWIVLRPALNSRCSHIIFTYASNEAHPINSGRDSMVDRKRLRTRGVRIEPGYLSDIQDGMDPKVGELRRC
jgi:hypothetical protein